MCLSYYIASACAMRSSVQMDSRWQFNSRRWSVTYTDRTSRRMKFQITEQQSHHKRRQFRDAKRHAHESISIKLMVDRDLTYLLHSVYNLTTIWPGLALHIASPPTSNRITAHSLQLAPSPNLKRTNLTNFTHQAQSLSIEPRRQVFKYNRVIHEDLFVPCWIPLVISRW